MYKDRRTKSYKGNQYGLVYKNAIKENKEGKVNIHPITYELNRIKVAANIYTPAFYNESKDYSAVVIAHPNGAVKEQAAGLYAEKLAEYGYITIVADAMYTGESGGEPRNQDIPYYRIEDIRGMIDVISVYPGVNHSHIYALGICGGGGYTLSAAQMDKRIQRVATVSMFNTGSVRREGFQNSQANTILERLHDIAQIRQKEIQSGDLTYNANMSDMDPEVGHHLPIVMYREGYEYYVETHAHPHSQSRFLQRNLMDLMVYDPIQFMYLIDQPLLMIVGSDADTQYMSEDAFQLAIGNKNKELYYIQGATHVQTYYVPSIVDEAIHKLVEFYK